MKKIYWRPRAVSRPALLLIALVSLAGLSLVERYKVRSQQPYFADEALKCLQVWLDAGRERRKERLRDHETHTGVRHLLELRLGDTLLLAELRPRQAAVGPQRLGVPLRPVDRLPDRPPRPRPGPDRWPATT